MTIADDIKQRLDIVDVVSGYAPNLRRAGRNFAAPCPFHDERTPSFYVFPDRQSWRCFGACATGGDVLSFVMRAEKLEFKDALRLLAERAGVSLAEARRDDPQRNALYRVNDAAQALFQDALRGQQGIAARAYLQGRGIDADAARRFGLGLSPSSGNALMEHLTALGFAREQVIEAGLATRGGDLPSRDMFLGRVMVPIHDGQGNLAGFGGRSLDGSEPKYLNSPRTPVFDKGRILYLFHRARKAIREQGEAVIVEGYMDAIAAHMHGYENVVASMGTALTQEQVSILKGAAKKFIMALDADAAGQQATFRSLRDSWGVFQQAFQGNAELSLRVLVVPAGKDPDEYIRANPKEWGRLTSEAQNILDYLLASLPRFWDITTSQGKAQAAEEVKALINKMGNAFDQDTYFRKLAQALGVSLETLEAAIGKPGAQARGGQGRRAVAGRDVSSGVFEQKRRDLLEEHFLGMLLRWPELRGRVQELDPHCLSAWEDRQVFTEWMHCSTMEELTERLEGELRPRAEHLLTLALPPMDLRQREQAIVDCFHRLEERRLRAMKEEEALLLTQAQPGEGQQEGKPQSLDDLSSQAIATNQALRQLFLTKSLKHRRGQES
ncbi:MAG: DNA primase [Chloroflexi bacterium]|nr:DNA primase [Chloroflexota bacterium]